MINQEEGLNRWRKLGIGLFILEDFLRVMQFTTMPFFSFD